MNPSISTYPGAAEAAGITFIFDRYNPIKPNKPQRRFRR
jgi:hypothetical protein